MHRLKRPSSPVVDHRTTKRRKPAGATTEYCTREIPWSEQKALGKEFRDCGEGAWPARKILGERGAGTRKQYLVEWKPHPNGREIFEPTWQPADNVGDGLKEEWIKERTEEQEDPDITPYNSDSVSSSVRGRLQGLSRPVTNDRRLRNRRVVPDSSGHESDPGSISRTPTLTGTSSPGSTSSALFPVEVLETQQPAAATAFTIDVPTPPANRADYGSIRGSQFSTTALDTSQALSASVLTDTPQGFRPSSTFRHTGTASRNSSPQNILSIESLQSTQSPDLRSLPAPHRILRYHPEVEVPNSAQNSLESSSISQQSQSQAPGVQESSLVSKNNSSAGSAPLLQPETSILPEPKEAKKPFPPPPSSSHNTSPSLTFQTQYPPIGSLPESSSLRTIAYQQASPTRRISLASLLNGSAQDIPPQPSMAARTRQSPRLQAVSPVSGTSPRVTVRTNSNRSRVVTTAPEVSSPLATALPEFPDEEEGIIAKDFTESPSTTRDYSLSFPDHMEASVMPPTTIPPSDMHINPSSLSTVLSSQNDASDVHFSSIAMPIQQSIEEEPSLSNEDMSLESKTSSSQGSLKDERPIPQVDGIVLPTYPILGEDEYCVALPADGKVQALYQQILKAKRRSILRFIRRRGSVNTASTSSTKTEERNTMLELVQRLHDVTTHTDLGLPGVPTQYTIPSQEHARYAEYAGSKFMLLGFVIDELMRRDCTIAILANPGATHDLLEEYMQIKKVDVRRHNGISHPFQLSPDQRLSVKVELLSTKASTMVDLERKPLMIIAFDATFESMNQQLRHTRAQFDDVIPVVHLMVTNSSEQVERSLPVSMPSPIRLKTLVRAVYQAQDSLGGTPSYVPDPEVESLHVGRGMDLAELNRTIRKSPKRKLQRLAAELASIALSDDFATNWTLSPMPPLAYSELEDTPPSSKESVTASNTPNARRARSQTPLSRPSTQRRPRSRTPVSRLGTPNARKRQSETDSMPHYSKRQRTTPALEIPSTGLDNDRARAQELERELEAMRAELTVEKQARLAAEQALAESRKQQEEWRTSLAGLQRRYEKRMKKSHQAQREKDLLTRAVENGKTRIEKLNVENGALRQQLVQAGTELTAAREDLKAAGGEVAILEVAREESRIATARAILLEKSLDNLKRDFEFTRSQYQDASSRAVEFALKMKDMEAEMAVLKVKASDETRKLKEMNHSASIARHLKHIEKLELEKRTREILLKRQDEEIKGLKRNSRAGVQTRGSSAQPMSVGGLTGGIGFSAGGTGTGSPASRSRQGSPALGHHGNAPPGSRASALRNER